MDPLEAINPIDGRYRRYTEELANYFSEKGLFSYRVKIEAEYFLALSEHPLVPLRELSDGEKDLVKDLSDLSLEDAIMIKEMETKGYGGIPATNHDVKAVEYFIKEKLKSTSLGDSLEWVHFALTSADVNNLAYSLMISDALTDVVLPQVRKIQGNLEDLAIRYADLPMLARTHGQPASPTTFGKEFNVYNTRIKRQIEQLRDRTLQAKLNGATGNYNAHSVACPEVSWINFTKSFIERLNTGRVVKLEPNFVTTQIEPHDSYAELFDNLRRTNNVLIDFDRDMWRYISDGWIVQKTVEGEVGSSIMPHKVNPINFENSEKNLIIANHWLDLFSNELTKSRLQRDLTDATLKRNIGVAFGHILVAYGALEKGLGKIEVNRKKVLDEVKSRPEVLAEAVQTILRREGVANPYEKLKELTRGKEVTLYVLAEFVDGLDIGPEVKSRIKSLTPESYLGLAEELAKL